ncbi:MAG: hypothetical protein HKN82_04960 [Akkermansiaceae bacterium]|nr:hypothetical protein [Akkermansiaceae bacterium]NNM28982.1 hypothetical protein [Akkermansiaceae bacterium]
MKAIQTTIAAAATAVLMACGFAGCTNFATPEANSAATGGLIGAGAGAVIADDSLKGAAIGGALGAGGGYLYEKSKQR